MSIQTISHGLNLSGIVTADALITSSLHKIQTPPPEENCLSVLNTEYEPEQDSKLSVISGFSQVSVIQTKAGDVVRKYTSKSVVLLQMLLELNRQHLIKEEEVLEPTAELLRGGPVEPSHVCDDNDIASPVPPGVPTEDPGWKG